MELTVVLLLALVFGFARANCEHAHFHGPPVLTTTSSSSTTPDDDDLPTGLGIITPTSRSLTVQLPSRFPLPDSAPAGLATWFLLDELVPGQRYETRACYTAVVGLKPS